MSPRGARDSQRAPPSDRIIRQQKKGLTRRTLLPSVLPVLPVLIGLMLFAAQPVSTEPCPGCEFAPKLIPVVKPGLFEQTLLWIPDQKHILEEAVPVPGSPGIYTESEYVAGFFGPIPIIRSVTVLKITNVTWAQSPGECEQDGEECIQSHSCGGHIKATLQYLEPLSVFTDKIQFRDDSGVHTVVAGAAGLDTVALESQKTPGCGGPSAEAVLEYGLPYMPFFSVGAYMTFRCRGCR